MVIKALYKHGAFDLCPFVNDVRLGIEKNLSER